MARTTEARSALGNTIKHHPDDAEAIAAARAHLREVVAEDTIRKLVESAPPLRVSKRAELAAMLLAPAGDAA